MPTKFLDLVKLLKADGWEFDHASGSHYTYKHPARVDLRSLSMAQTLKSRQGL
jgi:predicted RNA binding protein YcfA (HicA-like mRNA interferase family)